MQMTILSIFFLKNSKPIEPLAQQIGTDQRFLSHSNTNQTFLHFSLQKGNTFLSLTCIWIQRKRQSTNISNKNTTKADPHMPVYYLLWYTRHKHRENSLVQRQIPQRLHYPSLLAARSGVEAFRAAVPRPDPSLLVLNYKSCTFLFCMSA